MRSATNLKTCIINDFETTLSKKLTASLPTLDIKGAFDGVLPGRLIRRLKEQGWPCYLVSWVKSFASNRLVKIRLDGSTGPPIKIPCGLPQGSPAYPILFMLYIAPLFKLGCPKLEFGHIGRVTLLLISPSPHHNAQLLALDFEEVFN